MNRKILLIIIGMIIPFSIFAQSDYAFKLSGGLINTPNIDEEIVIDTGDPELTFEDYGGKEGSVYKLSVAIKHAEFGYKILNYSAEKDADGEKGDIEFDTQTAFVAIYFGDPVDLVGLNMSLGVGTGITQLTINREYESGSLEIKDELFYAKEIHYFAGLHYGMSEMYGFSLIYTAQTMKTIEGEDFTNDFVELTIDFMY
jgi:hypothetical protein